MRTSDYTAVIVPGVGLAWSDGIRLRPHVSGADGDEAPAEPPAEFTLPDDLTTVADDDLASLEAQAVELFDAIRAGALDAEAIAHMSALAEGVEAIRAEAATRIEAAEAAQAEADALADRLHVPDPAAEGETPEGTPAEADPPAAEGETPDAAAEVVAEAEAATAEAAETPAAVVAAATPRRPVRVPLGAIRRLAPEPENTDTGLDVVITAAADLPGMTSGSRFQSRDRLAVALHDRARSLRLGGPGAVVASIATPVDEGATIRSADSAEGMWAAMQAAANPAALVASGGWCAPSSRIYNFFSIEGTDGLVDLPTLNIERGGIEFPVSPSLADVFGAEGEPWLWTEADDEDATPGDLEGTTKPCFRIPCPTFDEVRLDAHGLCISHGNLSDRAYPELTTRYVDLVMAAHLHLISGRLLTGMAAASTAVAAPIGTGAAASILQAVDLQAEDYRSQYRMADGAVLEAVFPEWVEAAMRSDISQRTGGDQSMLSVSDAQIAAWFADRKIRPQFVQDWQALFSSAPATAWPGTVTFLLYAAGTFVRGQGGTIDLGVVRDSTLNATNDHTAAWTEQFILLAKIGNSSRKVTVDLDVSGAAYCCPGEATS